MRLARKLALAFLIGVIGVMGANAYLQVGRERALFERDAVRDQHLLGRTLRVGVETFWPIYGEAAARRLIRHAVERGELRVRWVHLNVLPGDPDRPRAMGADLSAVAAGRELSLVAPYRRGQERRFTYVPVIIDGEVRGALEVSESTIDERQFSRVSTLQIIGATLAIVGLCGLIAIMVGVWIVGRPMRTLCEKARRVGEGDLSGPLAVAQHDEIGELAGEINSMCDRLGAARQEIAAATEARIATLEQLRHADRLKTVGQLASGIAHELGTPLNVVAGRAKLILRGDLPTDEVGRSARIVVEQTDRITGIIRQLLDFSRRRAATLATGDLVAIARRTLEFLSALAIKRNVTLALEGDPGPLLADVDASYIQQALTNLIVNGVQAMPQGGRLTVTLDRATATPPADMGGPRAEFVQMTVADEGQGIRPDDLPHVFEPFFTTKEVGEGTGLGLSVAYGIVREHGGWIAVDSVPGRGSRFVIYLRPAAAGVARVAS